MSDKLLHAEVGAFSVCVETILMPKEREREREYSLSSHFGSSVCTFVVGGLCCPLDLGGEVPGLTWIVPPGEPVELFPATLESHAVAVSIKWPL